MTRIVLSACFLAAVSPGQQLRRAVLDAEAVVVARPVGVVPLEDRRLLHRFEVVETLVGDLDGRFSVIEHQRVADVPKPVQKGTRLFCLQAARSGGPPEHAPFYRLTGYRGDNPEVTADDGTIRFVRIVLAAEAGQTPERTVDALVGLVLEGEPVVRTEAVELLRERPVLGDRLTQLQLSDLLMRAVGETEDIQFKISLASLCAERRMDRVVEALCMSMGSVSDVRYARAVGRIARFLHGERAVDVIRPAILRARRDEERNQLLLALGATRTDRALAALLRMRRIGGPSAPVDAALRAHGSPEAMKVIGEERKR